MAEIANRLGRRHVAIPVPMVRCALATLRKLNRTQYGPEQVDFLRFRPVLDNTRLKTRFGYTPQKTTDETFDTFMEARRG